MFNLHDKQACRYRRVGCLLGTSATLVALLLPAAGQTQPTLWRPIGTHTQPGAQAIAPAPPLAPVSRLVKEILELDARRALLVEQRESTSVPPLGLMPLGGQASATANEPSTAQPSDQPAAQMQAIVGVGRELSAIVVRSTDRWVFRVGHPSPVSGPDTDLQLVRIETPCAVFRKAPQASARPPLSTEPGTAVEPAEQQTLCLQHHPP